MKRFKFRLQKYMEWKKFKEDEIKMQLAKIRGMYNKELAKKNSFLEEVRLINEEMKNRKEELSLFDLIGYEHYIKGLKSLIKNQDLVLKEIKEEENKVVSLYVKAKNEREIVESLKKEKEKKYLYDCRKEEEKKLHEISLSIQSNNISGEDNVRRINSSI